MQKQHVTGRSRFCTRRRDRPCLKAPFLTRPCVRFRSSSSSAQHPQARSRIEEAEPPRFLYPVLKHRSQLHNKSHSPTTQVRSAILRIFGYRHVLCAPDALHSPQSQRKRAHFRSDWHRYNVQLNVQNSSVLVSEQAFERLSEEVESASEVESDDDAQRSTAIKTDLVTKILARTSLQSSASKSTSRTTKPPTQMLLMH